jgi:CBS domain-containing protein
VTITDIRAVPSNRWADTTAAQIMTPWARLIQVSPNTDLLDALRTMERANVRQVPVVESSRIVGLLSRENVVQYLRLRSELGV